MTASPLSPEALALQDQKRAERAAKKAAKQAANGVQPGNQQANAPDKKRFLQRDWIPLANIDMSAKRIKPVRIMTWNILAQCLIRRELFPGSDCLKWGERKAMMLAELEYHRSVDFICVQECDRMLELSEALPNHLAIGGKGRNKQHGCVIFYRSSRWTSKEAKVVHLDEEELSRGDPTIDAKKRRGGSRQTKNVALIGAFEEAEGGQGIIVVTTHLFWHPRYTYERVRQMIIILRSIRDFQQEHQYQSWPVIFAGDLNTSPSEAPYQLLANPGSPFPPDIRAEVDASRYVHTSVEKIDTAPVPAIASVLGETSASATGTNTPAEFVLEKDDEGEGANDNHEKSSANTREPLPEDGILTVDELEAIMKGLLGDGCKSAYDTTEWSAGGAETYASRGGFVGRDDGDTLKGRKEPGYTSFTPIWHLTLDYLFILPPTKDTPIPIITSVLRPATKAQLGDGLPRKGICASDHLAMACEIVW